MTKKESLKEAFDLTHKAQRVLLDSGINMRDAEMIDSTKAFNFLASALIHLRDALDAEPGVPV